MRRRLTYALGALALGWLAGPAPAADPVNYPAAAAPVQANVSQPGQQPRAPLLAPSDEHYNCGVMTQPAACADQGGWGHFFGGAGVYILKPYIEKDRAWSKTTGIPNTQGDFVNEQYTDFSYDTNAAPRVWLGWVSDCGLGVRARYFHFEADGTAAPGKLSASEDTSGRSDLSDDGFLLQSARPLGQYALDQPTTFLSPGGSGSDFTRGAGTDVLTVGSRLQMDVWDLEAIDEIRTCGWLFIIGGGIRHSDLAHYYDATRRNSTDTAGVDVRTLHSSHRFSGTGPLFGLDVRREFGDTGLALYGNARGACLFGDRRQLAFARASGNINHDNGNEVFGTDIGNSFLHKNDVVPVTEVEIGVEWSKNMGGVRPFIQVGLVGQAWFNALANDNKLQEGDNAPPTPLSANGLLGLFGVDIAAGVCF